jgi:exopolysaccharide production protein ExoY
MSDSLIVTQRARTAVPPPPELEIDLRDPADRGAPPEVLVEPIPALPGPVARCSRAKRVVDVVVASIALVVSAPVLVVLVILVKATSRGPAFYRPIRVGRHGSTFRCLKLRTMVCDADQRLARLLEESPELADEFQRDQKLRADPRVTRVGRILRKTSLDELPQLFNVLRGDMSMVGWRPLAVGEPQRYGLDFDVVCQARPGITGAWQTSGRNDLDYAQRVEIDVQYVSSESTLRDIGIMARTVTQMLPGRQHGAY